MRKMVDVTFGSSRYDDLVELRYKVLLEPLGLKLPSPVPPVMRFLAAHFTAS